MARQYSNLYAGGTLASGISNSATAMTVSTAAGLPVAFPYTLTIDKGMGTMEVVTVTNASGVNLTVTRGQDGTAAVAHNVGAPVSHDHSARDFSEPQVHIDATAAHGATGAVVGTTNTQTVTNKTVSAATNTINGFTASRFVTSDGTGRAVGTQSKAIPAGAVVGDTDTQTLTNKTLSSTTNVFPPLGLIGFAVFTANGSFTKATYPGIKAVRVRVVGGGGGGGGATATAAGQGSAGGGGGGGGYAERWISAASLAASETVTVGAAGTGATGTGTTGGASSFGAFATGNGGVGGAQGSSHTPPSSLGGVGGAGGTGATGDVNITGAGGDTGWTLNVSRALAGAGGVSQLGTGGAPSFVATSTPGVAGGNYGAGGSGGANGASQALQTGANGAPGVVLVEVYG